MRWWGKYALLAAMPLLAGCGGTTEDPQAAVLQELRALRTALAPAAVDDKALATALAPVLERLRGMQEEHRDLRDELGRWSLLLSLQGHGAPAAVPGARERTAAPPTAEPALAARLQELEQRLAAQQQRQDELETVMQRSLDATTRHVEQLLRGVEQLGGGGDRDLASPPSDAVHQPRNEARPAEAAAPTTAPRAEPTPAGPAPATGGEGALTDAELAARAEQQHGVFQSGRARMQQAWLVVVLAVGLGAIGFLAWRLLRTPRQSPRPSAKTAGGDEMTTDELWAAAGLLSEAVGRLRTAVPEPPPPRHQTQPPTSAPVAAASPAIAPFGPDEVFVLDDEQTLLAGVDFGASPPPPAAAPRAVTNGKAHAAEPLPAEPSRAEQPPAEQATAAQPPARWSVHLQARDPTMGLATIDAYLRHDPRVLRRPAPVVRRSGAQLLVECSLLPGLLPGESEHLRATMQRLLARI